jgi:hypothetical protein
MASFFEPGRTLRTLGAAIVGMVLKVLNEVWEVVEAVSVLDPHQALKLSISTVTKFGMFVLREA